MIQKNYFKRINAINCRKNILKACLVGIIHPASIIVAGFLAMSIFDYNALLGVIAIFFAIIFIGTRFRAINNMSHECFHFAFTKSRRANEIFGVIFSILECSKFELVRKEHQTHHTYLGDYEKDADFRALKKYKFWKTFSRDQINFHIKTALSFRFLKEYLFFVYYSQEDPLWGKIFRFMFLMLQILLLFQFPLEILLFLVIPYVTTYQLHKYLIDALDHGGLLNQSEELYKTRNFILGGYLLKLFFFPRNDTYHLVHHLFPSLAVECFAQAHTILMTSSEYKKLQHTAKEQVQVWFALDRQVASS